MATRYHFDLYPRTDPRDGTRIRRFNKLQRAVYRDVIGVGSGAADIRSTDAEAADLDPLGEQYVRVVREDTADFSQNVVAGFWINRFNHDTAVARETKRLTFSGAGHMAYLARARMWSHTYMGAAGTGAGVTTGAQDPFDDIWRLWAQGDWAGGDFLGACLWRVIAEAQSYQSGAYTHRHKDGAFYTDTHTDDRTGGSAISLITLGFDQFEDSDGNDWSVPSGEFQASIGENVLSVTQRLMQAGLYVEMDPDTFELRAWENDEHRRDRTGSAWGTNVVRFQAPTDATVDTGNMLSDSEREINSHLKRTIMLAGGQDSYAKATASGDIRWEGFEASTAAEGAALTQLASTQLTAREEASDAGSVRMKLGKTPLSGRYRPWEEVRLDDVVTVHTGTGEWDYDEAAYPVAGLKIELQKSGAWHAWAELGASFSPGADRRFQVHPPTAHTHPPNPELCRIGNPGTSTTTRLYFSTGGGDVEPDFDAAWDVTTAGGVNSLKTTAEGSMGGAHSSTSSNLGDVAGVNVLYWRGVYGPLSFAEAAVLAAGGAVLSGQIRAHARYGVGISESAQDMINQIGIRVTQGATTTIRGTALALHALTGTAGSARWPRSGGDPKANRTLPPAAASGVMTAVSGTAAGDYLVVEVGSRNFTPSDKTSGGSIALTNDSVSDLPVDDSTESALNSWIQWVSDGEGATTGDLPLDVVHQDEESVGTSVRAARCDHQHAHGLLSADGLHYHDSDQVSGGGSGGSGEVPEHSHPDPSQEASPSVAEGGWNHMQEPRAVAYRDRVYVGNIQGSSGDVALTVFNSADPSTAPIEKVLHAALETDIHNNATSVVRSSDHKLLTLYCGHVLANIYTRLSTTSLDTDPDLDDGFAAETNIDAALGSLSYSYPSIFQLDDGTIFIFYREGNATNGDWYYHTSTDGGSTWSARTMILTESGKAPYMKIMVNGDRLDFTAMDEHPFDGANGVYHFYYDSGSFFTSDGSALTLPATAANMTQVYDGSAAPAWIWDVAIGTDGHPRLAYSVFDGGTDHSYYYATWDGSAWASEEITTSADGEHVSGAPPGIALDRTDPTIAYLIRQVDELEVFRATRIGGTWSLDPITVDSASQNIYPAALHNPYPETRSGNSIKAVYLYGTYTGEDVWDLDIGLVITSGGTSGGATALDDLTDVTITAPAEDDTLRYLDGEWVNDNRRWEALTDGEDVFVWEDDDLVHEWKVY